MLREDPASTQAGSVALLNNGSATVLGCVVLREDPAPTQAGSVGLLINGSATVSVAKNLSFDASGTLALL